MANKPEAAFFDDLALMGEVFPEEVFPNEPNIEPIEEVKDVKSKEQLLKLCHTKGKELDKAVNIDKECNGLNTFCCIDEKGETEDFMSQACIADLAHASLSPEFVVDTLYKYKMRTYEDNLDQYAVNYLDWLFNRSPYSSCIATGDAKEVYRKGYYILKGESPSNLVGGAMVAVRMLWERPFIVKTWNVLVGMGVDENLSFVIAHSFNIKGGKLGDLEQLFGHIAINVYSMDVSDVKLFLSNSPISLNDPLKQNSRYDGLNRLFSKGNQQLEGTSFPRKMRAYLSKINFDKPKDKEKKDTGYIPIFTPTLNNIPGKAARVQRSFDLDKYAPYLTKITYQTIEELLS